MVTRAEAIALIATQLQTYSVLAAIKHTLDDNGYVPMPESDTVDRFRQAEFILDEADRYYKDPNRTPR